jgi:DNA-binding CsgD family transcriptional regulator
MIAVYVAATITSMLSLLSGLYIFRQGYRTAVYRLFFLLCSLIAILNILTILAYSSQTKESIVFWTQFVTVFTHTVFPLNLHFYIRLFTKKPLGIIKTVILYAPAVLLMGVPLLDYTSYYDFTIRNGEWKWLPSLHSGWLKVFAVFIVLYAGASIAAAFYYGRRATLMRERRQYRTLLLNFIISISLGIVTVGIIPAYYYEMPDIGSTYSIFYVSGIFYAVFRYGFLEIKPLLNMNEIISQMNDMVLLIGRDLKIIHANRMCSRLLGWDIDQLESGFFSDFIRTDNGTLSRLHAFLEGEEDSIGMRIPFKVSNGNENIQTDSRVSKVRDSFGDVVGLCIVSAEDKGKSYLKRTYKITDREFEVIALILQGLHNDIIGERLYISERTVESHCLHIYHKLRIKDKIELFALAASFNLPPKK